MSAVPFEHPAEKQIIFKIDEDDMDEMQLLAEVRLHRKNRAEKRNPELSTSILQEDNEKTLLATHI